MHACVKLIPLLTTIIVVRLGFHILNTWDAIKQKCYYSFIKKESSSALQRINGSILAVSTVPELVNEFLYNIRVQNMLIKGSYMNLFIKTNPK